MHQRSWPDNTFVCIPSYKAERTLRTFLLLLCDTVPRDRIIVIDDASGDTTQALCETCSVTCLRHDVNKGKGAALATGFKQVLQDDTAQWIITMDADGQHAIDDLPLFLSYVKEHPEVAMCIGKRNMRIGAMPFFRILSNRITSGIMSSYCNTRIFDSQCGYRIYSVNFLRKISIEYARFEMESEVILKAAYMNYPIGFVPVQTVYHDGGSHISHLRDTVRWIRAVVKITKTYADTKKN
jgi:dolichol-phosphate mannosyltransferase